MTRTFIKALLVATVCMSATALAMSLATSKATSSEPSPVVRNECEAPTCHAVHSTVALPPPLTIAYQDPYHPDCASCVTYSDLYVDNDGDECCKPAAVIKTHNFIKEVHYKCCTGPCGDVECEPCCTKITCNPCRNKDAITVYPGGSKFCNEGEGRHHRHHKPCCHHRGDYHDSYHRDGDHHDCSGHYHEEHPCDNKCVEMHHCYASNTDPCPCKDNCSVECCITHCTVEPTCSCGCGCHPPVCTPSFLNSPEPQLVAAPSPAPFTPLWLNRRLHAPRAP